MTFRTVAGDMPGYQDCLLYEETSRAPTARRGWIRFETVEDAMAAIDRLPAVGILGDIKVAPFKTATLLLNRQRSDTSGSQSASSTASTSHVETAEEERKRQILANIQAASDRLTREISPEELDLNGAPIPESVDTTERLFVGNLVG
jgi:hypothetical protein